MAEGNYDTSRGFKATISQKELQAFEERKNKILNELKVKILAIIWEAQKKVYWINSS
ncbi:hypothetical protein J4214_03430 [Candidatus Woesearchaeota archaeon]|nr:hypothetical protein [Candidatus Woesearchaeota archaeon]